ncbi:formate/nitrite transporter family protein [Acholeplasma palmae]|nr:formate/nitrite transporter family protein [Alteracholeplasma palmae]
MNRYIIVLTKAILAGLLIGIAGTIYLTLDNKTVGAFLFGFGLLVICSNKLNLYTGKVGYIIDRKPNYLIDVLIIIIGNFIGTGLIALMVNLGGLLDVVEIAKQTVLHKLDHKPLETFMLAIGCGMLMYIGVDGYYKNKNDFGKVIIVVMAVAIFILAKFEHSIADMFYFMVSGTWNIKAFLYFIVMLLGNALGSVIINGLEKTVKRSEKIEENHITH